MRMPGGYSDMDQGVTPPTRADNVKPFSRGTPMGIRGGIHGEARFHDGSNHHKGRARVSAVAEPSRRDNPEALLDGR